MMIGFWSPSGINDVIEQGLDREIPHVIELAAIPPQERKEEHQPRWTLKRLVKWVKEQFLLDCCRETVRKSLKKAGLSWKKARIYIDEAHIHLDTDEGYGWSVKAIMTDNRRCKFYPICLKMPSKKYIVSLTQK